MHTLVDGYNLSSPFGESIFLSIHKLLLWDSSFFVDLPQAKRGELEIRKGP